MSKYKCICCDKVTLDEPASGSSCEICRNCGWEHWDDCASHPGDVISPNYISLNDAREVFKQYGAGVVTQMNIAHGLTRAEIEAMDDSERATLERLMDKE